MRKLAFTLALFLFCGMQVVFAQKVVTGKVTDSNDGTSIPGVNISVKGTKLVAQTGVNGEFSIRVPDNSRVLVFTFVGYDSQEVPVGSKTVIKIELKASATTLNEVVVTALGISRSKKSLGYSVQDVKSADLNKTAQSNVISSLNGKVAGLQISQSGGQIGASSRVVIRGNSSFGDNQPLIVVDGIPVSNNSLLQNNVDFGSGLYDINPEDIESVSVLKGGSAALYGMRAGHGVILITTKSGKNKKNGISVTYDGNYNIDQVYGIQKMQNKYGQGYLGDEAHYKLAQADGFTGTYQQFAQGEYDPGYGFSYVDGLGSGVNDGVDESWGPRLDSGLKLTQFTSPRDASGNLIATDWISHPNNIKDFYQLGHTTNHNISIASTSENSNTRASIGYRDQTGTLPNTDLKRYSASINSTFKLNKQFDYDFSANYIRSESKNLPLTEYNASNPMESMGQWFGRQIDMSALKDHWTETMDNGYPYNWNSNYHNNPYWSMYKNLHPMEKNRLFGKTSLFYKPVDFIKIEGRIGLDYYDTKTTILQTYQSNETQLGTNKWSGGYFRLNDSKSYELNADLIASFSKTFGDFNVDALVGSNYRNLRAESSIIGADQLTVPDLFTISNVAGSPYNYMSHSWIRSNSVYASASIGYKGQYFLEGSARNDWSSTIKDPFFYPAVSASWIPTETFKLKSDILSYLKLRGGWAKIGSATSAYKTDPYFSAISYTIKGVTQYQQTLEYPPASLRPEGVETKEIGVETKLLKNRISIDFSIYDKKTTDQIMSVAVSKATGYNTALVNAGNISNKGLELQLRASILQNDNGLNWDMTINWAKDKSKIISLYTDPVTGQSLTSYTLGSQWSTNVVAMPGKPWGVIMGTGMVRNADGAVIVDANGLPMLKSNMEIGNVAPDWTGGINNEFRYKNFSFGFLIDIRKGGDFFSISQMFGAYSGVLNFTAESDFRENGLVLGKDFLGGTKFVKIVSKNATDVTKSTFTDNDIKANAQDFFESYYSNRELSIIDGSYVKLREMHLSYDLPKKLFTKRNLIKSGTLSLVGSNLATLWLAKNNLAKIDPETSVNNGTNNGGVGLETTSYPPSRSYGIKLSFTF